MCGRFTQRHTWSEVHAFLSVIGAAKNLRPRYNIAPTTTIDVVRLGGAAASSSRCAGSRAGLVEEAAERRAGDLQRPGRDGGAETDVPRRL